VFLRESGFENLHPACVWHVEDEPSHLRGLIHLDEVSSTRHKNQFGHWKEFMEAAGDASIQVRVRVTENDPDWPSELPKSRERFGA
jgi:hypothetical protein